MVKKNASAPTDSLSFFAVVVLPVSAGCTKSGGQLQTACRQAGLAQTGHINRLGEKGHWLALELAVTCPRNNIGKARQTLANAFAGIGDTGLVPAGNRRKKVLVCDMDSTIIAQECIDELAEIAGLADEIQAITEHAMAGRVDFETALIARVQKLAGLPLDSLRQCHEDRLSLIPGAKTLVATMKAHGAICHLVSGGFDYFAKRIADKVGFHGYHANRLIDDGKALTGALERPILGCMAKLDLLDEITTQAGCSRDDSLAMGDGANDLEMIRAAGLGFAVHANPVVVAIADSTICHTGLISALYFQGYRETEIIWQD